MNRNIKIVLYVLSLILFVVGFIPALNNIKIMIYVLAILLCGYDLLIEGIINIFKLNFEEDTLMTIAVIAAFILGEFPESVAVILLYKLGEDLEERASETSNDAIEEIAKIKSETANLYIENDIKSVDVKELKAGDKILIKAGEKVPVDSKILKGMSMLDVSNITGESKPQNVKEKQEILSGSINLSSSIECEVVKDFEHSTASEIVDLVYQAKNNKGKTENFITKFSKIYTPIVIILAILIAIVPSIAFGGEMQDWIKRGLVFLVASCPCSIVISIPLAFFACLGNISKKGMLIKGSKYIENLSKLTAICFDKTGTLTTGKMIVDKIQATNIYTEDEILTYVYNLEKLSNHPIATAIIGMNKNIETKQVAKHEEIPGMGLYGLIDGKDIVVGNRKILEKFDIKYKNLNQGVIYIGIDKELAGYIVINEEIRKETENLINQFRKINIKRVAMLTGDNFKSANKVANKLQIEEIYSELLPKDKLEKLKSIQKEGNIVAFVGDGINDSPVLASSDFGISMGKGTEIANNSADGILLSNNITSLPEIIVVSRKSMKIIKQNIIFSILLKLIVLILGILGIAPIWLAVLADTGATAITVVNSMRILKF